MSRKTINNRENELQTRLQLASSVKDFAAFLSTSGAILGTSEQYSPTSHRILALAMGTCQINIKTQNKQWKVSV